MIIIIIIISEITMATTITITTIIIIIIIINVIAIVLSPSSSSFTSSSSPPSQSSSSSFTIGFWNSKGLQIIDSRLHSQTVSLKVGIICMLGALGELPLSHQLQGLNIGTPNVRDLRFFGSLLAALRSEA